ncbi:MAG: hypothetical protein MTP17_00400 [Candidatus Midichloria sp.]|nr:MAG: hypothetical protein MTP17_00400 [Candidatus Midichloria sp.]
MNKRKFNDMQADSINKRSNLADNTAKDMGYQASSSLNTIYSNKSIKSLLKSYLPNVNIEDIYLSKVTGDHVYYNFVNNLKGKLIHETKDKVVSDDKFYVIIEQSINSDLQVSSVTVLKLYSKNNKNRIKILPIVGSTSGLLISEFQNTSELKTVQVKLGVMLEWFCENQSINVYLDNLIEVIKLSIEYKTPGKVPDDMVEKIMNTPYTEYEKSHQELLNTLKVTDGKEINELSLADKDQGEVIVSASIKKTVSWDPLVEDNEGYTTRREKHKFKTKTEECKKEKDEVEEYFEQCITSWHWDQKIWEKRYFHTNKLNSDKFQHLLDKHCDRIRGKFGGHILKKHHYDCPGCYQGCNLIEGKLLNKIIDGYTFLMSYSPNLLSLLMEYQKSMLESFSQNDIDMLAFYNAHPELKLINLIEKRISNIDIVEKGHGNIPDGRTDIEVLVDVTNHDQENFELKLAGNSLDSYE